MNKRVYRFFGGLLMTQENWLNKMAGKGYRLVRTTKAMYEFEECTAGQYQYKVEYIGQKSKRDAAEYVRFLEECGYRVFFKNINLNWSVGKVEVRPWAEKSGRIATQASTLYRELLIVEKENDGKAFELHTTFEDRKRYYRAMQKPWVFLFLVSTALGIAMRSIVWGVFGALSLVGAVLLQLEIGKLKKSSAIEEW